MSPLSIVGVVQGVQHVPGVPTTYYKSIQFDYSLITLKTNKIEPFDYPLITLKTKQNRFPAKKIIRKENGITLFNPLLYIHHLHLVAVIPHGVHRVIRYLTQ